MPDPIPDHEPWRVKISSRLPLSSAKRQKKAKRSNAESFAFSAGHAALITIIAVTTGVGFYSALGIVALVIFGLRLVVHLRGQARRSPSETAANPFGR